jgi:predicted transcriptional regulator
MDDSVDINDVVRQVQKLAGKNVESVKFLAENAVQQLYIRKEASKMEQD